MILGILSAVAIPQVTKFIRSGKVSAGNGELALVKTAVATAMADAQISTLPGTGGTSIATPLTPSADFTVATGYSVGAYITGGFAVLKGSYTFNANGTVATGSYPNVTGFISTGGSFQ